MARVTWSSPEIVSSRHRPASTHYGHRPNTNYEPRRINHLGNSKYGSQFAILIPESLEVHNLPSAATRRRPRDSGRDHQLSGAGVKQKRPVILRLMGCSGRGFFIFSDFLVGAGQLPGSARNRSQKQPQQMSVFVSRKSCREIAPVRQNLLPDTALHDSDNRRAHAER
jgi:hypothetical protein